jgi:hypothetical protein
MEIRIIIYNGKTSIYVNNQKFNIDLISPKQKNKLEKLIEQFSNYIQYLNKQGF